MDDLIAFIVARLGEARASREAKALRAILDLHKPDEYGCQVCADPPLGRACETLSRLAAAWNDHPDYRQEWAS